MKIGNWKIYALKKSQKQAKMKPKSNEQDVILHLIILVD
jgi:hypothetical protein